MEKWLTRKNYSSRINLKNFDIIAWIILLQSIPIMRVGFYLTRTNQAKLFNVRCENNVFYCKRINQKVICLSITITNCTLKHHVIKVTINVTSFWITELGNKEAAQKGRKRGLWSNQEPKTSYTFPLKDYLIGKKKSWQKVTKFFTDQIFYWPTFILLTGYFHQLFFTDWFFKLFFYLEFIVS